MAQETPFIAPGPAQPEGLAPGSYFQSSEAVQPVSRDQEIESDWSDVEERKPQLATAAPMELEDGPTGEIKSKHEIKLQPFAQPESDSQREVR
jgi:hypothetical protein